MKTSIFLTPSALLSVVFLTLLSFLVIGSTAYAKDIASQPVHKDLLNNYKPEKIAGHTYVIHGPGVRSIKENQGFINNPAFIITNKSVIVIDPGSSVQIGRSVLAHIRKVTNKPVSHIFITHVHGDHWLGNQAFYEENPKVKIYAHPLMIKAAHAGEAEEWVERMERLTDHATAGTKAIIPTETLKDQQSIKVGDITIKPHLIDWAHTKTDAMLEVVEDKVLFTGDIVNNGRLVVFENGSFRGSIKSIQNAEAMPINKVVPGHGKTGGKEVLSDNRELLNTIYTTVKTLMEDDMEAHEMKPEVLKKLGQYQSWGNVENEIGRYIIKAVLEAEQAEFE